MSICYMRIDSSGPSPPSSPVHANGATVPLLPQRIEDARLGYELAMRLGRDR
jgi:hypothetical protein